MQTKTFAMCPDTFMPFQELKINLRVYCDAQHDGHPWPYCDVKYLEGVLVEEVMNKIRQQVNQFVSETKPFAIHEK